MDLSPPRLSLKHTLALIAEHLDPNTPHWSFIQKYRVILRRGPLETFAVHGTTCRGCGLEATHFQLDPHDQAEFRNTWHLLHLYAEKDGELILFTQDHTIARCLGGTDDLFNRAPMCYPCNQAKAKAEADLAKSTTPMAPVRKAKAKPSKAKPAKLMIWTGKAHKRKIGPARFSHA